MENLDEQLTRAGTAAHRAPTPPIDVRSRVRQTISTQSVTTARVDLLPVGVGSALVTLAAATCTVLFPYWQLMLDPWASYFGR